MEIWGCGEECEKQGNLMTWCLEKQRSLKMLVQCLCFSGFLMGIEHLFNHVKLENFDMRIEYSFSFGRMDFLFVDF